MLVQHVRSLRNMVRRGSVLMLNMIDRTLQKTHTSSAVGTPTSASIVKDAIVLIHVLEYRLQSDGKVIQRTVQKNPKSTNRIPPSISHGFHYTKSVPMRGESLLACVSTPDCSNNHANKELVRSTTHTNTIIS